jgi:hypothetical protein
MVGCLLIGWSGRAPAQEPSGHADLDLLAAMPSSRLVVVRVVFTPTAAICPQRLGTLRFRADGSINELTAFGFLSSPHDWQAATTALDDETYRSRVATDSCRVDLDIGEQVRLDNVWTPVLLPRQRRPSLTQEERRKATQEYANSHPDPVPLAQFGSYIDAGNARGTLGSLRQGGVGAMAEGLPFDGAQRCFEAVGDYLVDQRGLALQFVANLPGGLNRFAIERVDIDDEHSRLYLTRGDCRFALTIGASVRAGDQWVSRSIAPFIEPKSRAIPSGGPSNP